MPTGTVDIQYLRICFPLTVGAFIRNATSVKGKQICKVLIPTRSHWRTRIEIAISLFISNIYHFRKLQFRNSQLWNPRLSVNTATRGSRLHPMLSDIQSQLILNRKFRSFTRQRLVLNYELSISAGKM